MLLRNKNQSIDKSNRRYVYQQYIQENPTGEFDLFLRNKKHNIGCMNT